VKLGSAAVEPEPRVTAQTITAMTTMTATAAAP
jgi:hypothetical protein